MIMGTFYTKGSGSGLAGAARDPYFNTHLPPLSYLIFLRFPLNKLGTEGIGKKYVAGGSNGKCLDTARRNAKTLGERMALPHEIDYKEIRRRAREL